jgi:hypothetical protein
VVDTFSLIYGRKLTKAVYTLKKRKKKRKGYTDGNWPKLFILWRKERKEKKRKWQKRKGKERHAPCVKKTNFLWPKFLLSYSTLLIVVWGLKGVGIKESATLLMSWESLSQEPFLWDLLYRFICIVSILSDTCISLHSCSLPRGSLLSPYPFLKKGPKANKFWKQEKRQIFLSSSVFVSTGSYLRKKKSSVSNPILL